MAFASSDGDHAGQATHLYGGGASDGGTVAQLASAIGASGPYCPIGLRCQAMENASSEGPYIAKAAYQHRCGAVGEGAVTQLTVAVVAPCGNLSAA